jgi:uncharacterized membrane protein
MAGDELDDPHLRRFRKMPTLVRVVYARPRLFISIVLGLIGFFLLPGSLRLVTRLLMAWDISIAFYLTLAFVMIFQCGVVHIPATPSCRTTAAS